MNTLLERIDRLQDCAEAVGRTKGYVSFLEHAKLGDDLIKQAKEVVGEWEARRDAARVSLLGTIETEIRYAAQMESLHQIQNDLPYRMPTEAEVDEMARLDMAKTAGSPHEL